VDGFGGWGIGEWRMEDLGLKGIRAVGEIPRTWVGICAWVECIEVCCQRSVKEGIVD
jgi:hypothetical protein